MVRRLEMDKTQGIEQLYSAGLSKRKIARTLGIDRKSVDRHLAGIISKGAMLGPAPIGEALTGSNDSKGAKAPTGSEASPMDLERAQEPAERGELSSCPGASSRSECVRFRDQIMLKIEQGLTAQRIYQDLVSD